MFVGFSIFFLNHYSVRLEGIQGQWTPLKNCASFPSLGCDFESIRVCALRFRSGISPFEVNLNYYPPFATLFSILFTFIPLKIGFQIHTFLSFLAHIASVFYIFKITQTTLLIQSPEDRRNTLPFWLILTCVITFLSLSGAPFEFNIAVGNLDHFPILLMILSTCLLMRHEKSFWLPTLFLSLAIHLKLYPAILLPILLWKYGKKIILPLIVINSGLLFCLGYQNALQFIHNVAIVTSWNLPQVYNNSAFAFGSRWANLLGQKPGPFVTLATFVPLSIWGILAYQIFRRGYSQLNVFFYLILSVPLMCFIPAISKDYKLVLLTPFILAMILFHQDRFRKEGGFFPLILASLTLLCFRQILLPSLEDGNLFFQNKYPVIFLFEILTVVTILSTYKSKPASSI